MSDKQTELERQVANLTLEVARLRRSIYIGFVILGVLLCFGFTAPQMIPSVFAIGFVIWGVFYIAATLMDVLTRRAERKRERHVA